MSGRPRKYKTEVLVERAIAVFWKTGYDSTSAKDLLQALQIGQGSFYNTFEGGKRELFEKCLKFFSERELSKFHVDLQQSDDSIEFLINFFRETVHYPKERKLKGCLLCNTIVEQVNIDSELKNTATKLLARLEDSFKTIIMQAQTEGRLENRTSPEILAKYLINLWNGINITQRLNPNDKILKSVIEMNLNVLR